MKKNVHEIEVKIEGKEWSDILDKVFNKKRKEVKIDGFRKGSVPKEVYMKKVGIESLYMDAVDAAVGSAYKKALSDNKLLPVIEPKIDVSNISKDEVVFKFTIVTKPDIKLGDYKNLDVKKQSAKISKKEIEDEIKNLQSKYAEIVEKEKGVAEEGNTAIIDFIGYVDGKELEGGKGENYPLELGSNTFIPGFEENVKGMKINEEKSIDLKFPENYTEDLKNKDVTFKVTLKGLKERVYPEINEEFFMDLGYDDVKTKEELESKIKEDLAAQKEKELDNKYTDECLEKAANNMTIDLNEEIIDDEVHHMIHQFEDQLKMQGLNLDQYMQFSGVTHEDLHKQMEGEATKRVKYRYLLEAVIDAEKIEVTDEEAKEEEHNIAKEYNMTIDEVEKQIDLEMVKYDLKMRKAMDIIKG
jgi:trigger factor